MEYHTLKHEMIASYRLSVKAQTPGLGLRGPLARAPYLANAKSLNS